MRNLIFPVTRNAEEIVTSLGDRICWVLHIAREESNRSQLMSIPPLPIDFLPRPAEVVPQEAAGRHERDEMQDDHMKYRLILLSLLVLGLAQVGCKSTVGRTYDLEPHAQALTDAGWTLGILKALDAGNTNRAYQATLIQLKGKMLQLRDGHFRNALKAGDRQIALGISMVILSYIEQQKERLGQEPGTDYCALEITKALAGILDGDKEKARLKELHDYFSSRFVKEREFYD